MLIETEYLTNSKKLICSYVDKRGDIKLKYLDFPNPMKYIICDPNDPQKHPLYKSWQGKSVKQIETTHPDRYAIYEHLDGLGEDEKNDIFEFNLPKIFFVDIETEIVDGFPEAETANTRVLSISVVYDNIIILLGLEDMSEEVRQRIEDNTNQYFSGDDVKYKLKYIKYDDEFDLMYAFFYKMVPKMPVITGWNFLDYDWRYLVNRARKLTKNINGKVYDIRPEVSSFTKRLRKAWGKEFELPQHRMIFDYMKLYEMFDTSIKVKESSSLDFVSNKLVGVEKIKYTGSLQKLYEDDFETFMYYNAVDSVLVQKIHEKMNYISIVFAISSLAKIKVTDVISHLNDAPASLAITEGVLRNRFRELDGIVLFKDTDFGEQQAEGIAGGWVKDPVIGMNRWVACYDFASLYPTVIRQFFITPENFIGVQSKTEKDYCFNNSTKILIDLEQHVVCTNGIVFNKQRSPTIIMLEDVYSERKKNKKIMMMKKEEYENVLDEIRKLELELA